ncbi:CusA/CzcA family heavy metal efflux RND transporter [Rufibacter quisquiliarum]|uniref:Cobalt-zinc-cadmium resistance protein CzcA n=1 Tax=Rufibacter quisquiliarum TaxID=1549639 RepID=A0A839GDK0_9BACT|nr:CusA/CzcA family heavy metal efflux RND transporter [Rufibacter quisquiliarum]MBA9077674.1 cobalt-zinc-cadmium resistance protein CzcA [Rufibacter quisquiliarum]
MLQKIIEFSIKNKLVIGLLTVALVAWGVYNVQRLPIDAVPDITNNQVQVITVSPSLGAQEVERLISFPVEQSVASVPGVTEIRSFSRFGLSLVTVVFDEDRDIYWARQQITEKLKEAEEQIPEGMGSPTLAPISSGLGEIYQYELRPAAGYESQYNATELRTIQDWIVRRQLLGTPGVAEVSSFGGKLKQYEVAINPEKLRSFNLTITHIFNALEKNNANAGGAYIEKDPNAYFIRTEGLVQSPEDIGRIVVTNTAGGAPVLIRDVAEVREGSAIRYGAMVNEQGEVAGGIVMMLKGENSSQVIQRVKDKVSEIRKTLPPGVVLEPFLDRTKLVNRAINTVEKNLAEGALIVVFVLVLLLGNWRAGLLVASVIPLAMLFAISLMNVFGVSGNLMSLGALDFGLIVDGAVIIVEAVIHSIHTSEYAQQGVFKLSRKQMDDEVQGSASKMMGFASFGQIIILIVYLPILALVGIEGKMFKPMAQTVSFAILGAFLLSLTYVPMMASLVLSRKTQHKENISDRIMQAINRAYQPLLNFALRAKTLVLGIALGLFALSLVLFTQMGGEFIPSLDEGDFAIETRVLTGSSLNETIEVVQKASKVLKQTFPEVEKVVTKIGSAEVPTEPNPVELGDMIVVLKERAEWTSASSRVELANKMSDVLHQNLPQATFGVQQPIQMRFNELMTGARQDVVLKIYGEDMDQLALYAQKIGKLVQPIEGAQDLYIEEMSGLPQVVVQYDREQIARYGLTIEDVNRTVTSAFAGEIAGQVYEGEKRFDLVVRLNQQNRQDIADVQRLYVSNENGLQIPLEHIAQVEMKEGPNQIQRDGTRRRITIGFNVRNRDVQSIVTEIQQKIEAQIQLPPGYTITYGGEFQNLIEAKERLSVAVPLALALIFVLLFFAFKSIKQSILIFTAIPLSAIGGVFALLLRDMPFSISAGVGFIALFGVAVLNGIVMIGYFNQLKASGMTNLEQIIREGTAARLRPIIMTATVASLGFLPMALSSSAGAEVQKPLATVVIGGLLSATLLTLVVLPIIYYFSEKGFGGLKKSAALWFLPLGLALPLNTQAQGTPSQTLSMPQVLELTKQHNQQLKSAALEVEMRGALQKTAVDIPKTELSYSQGEINSPVTDDRIGISQTIPFPTVWKAQSKLLQEQKNLSQQQLNLEQHELLYQVKQAYARLAFLYQTHQLLQRQDSIFQVLERAAEVRFRTGETGLLEKTTATTQRLELTDRLRQNQSALAVAQAQLNALVQAPQPLHITPQPLQLDSTSIGAAETQNHPLLQVHQQQIAVADRERQVEKSRLAPDITLGYFNQSLIGTYDINGRAETAADRSRRFQGVEAGVAVPLWQGAQRARVKAAALGKQAAEASLQNQQHLLQSEWQAAQETHQRLRQSLHFYREQVLVNARLALTQADKAYRSGEASYLSYLQAADQQLRTQQNYLQLLLDYQLNVFQLQYLGGN